MRQSPRTKHIFLVGMPRSGTTMVFESLAAHEDLAWFSNYLQRLPATPSVCMLSRLTSVSSRVRRSVRRSDQKSSWLERIRIGPDEAYGVWERCCGTRFRFDYLLGVKADPVERDCMRAVVTSVLRYHGKPHFAAKLTGPGRIGYLSSIFPEARFVHVVRDGRAVVQSLMNVPFWRTRDRMHEPAWRNGLTERDLADWDRCERSPLALAAVQWRRVIETTRDEATEHAPARYAEVNYERFVVEPHRVLRSIAEFCELSQSAKACEFLRQRVELHDMNRQWRERFDQREVTMLHELLCDALDTLGYDTELTRPPYSHPAIVTPFLKEPRAPSGATGG